MNVAESTIALSVHNAIVKLNVPSEPAQIRIVLHHLYCDAVTDAEIVRALAQLVHRGHVRYADGKFDTLLRVNGKRQMITVRPRDEMGRPLIADGWF